MSDEPSSVLEKEAGRTYWTDLKLIRMHRGISLKEVHSATKVPIEILTALEESGLVEHDRFNPIYRRSLLRAYASAVRLPEKDVIAAWEAFERDSYQGGLAEVYLDWFERESADREEAAKQDRETVPDPSPEDTTAVESQEPSVSTPRKKVVEEDEPAEEVSSERKDPTDANQATTVDEPEEQRVEPVTQTEESAGRSKRKRSSADSGQAADASSPVDRTEPHQRARPDRDSHSIRNVESDTESDAEEGGSDTAAEGKAGTERADETEAVETSKTAVSSPSADEEIDASHSLVDAAEEKTTSRAEKHPRTASTSQETPKPEPRETRPVDEEVTPSVSESRLFEAAAGRGKPQSGVRPRPSRSSSTQPAPRDHSVDERRVDAPADAVSDEYGLANTSGSLIALIVLLSATLLAVVWVWVTVPRETDGPPAEQLAPVDTLVEEMPPRTLSDTLTLTITAVGGTLSPVRITRDGGQRTSHWIEVGDSVVAEAAESFELQGELNVAALKINGQTWTNPDSLARRLVITRDSAEARLLSSELGP